MTYAIFADSDRDRLEQRINEAIAHGWRPLGGVAVAVSDWEDGGMPKEFWQYAQAMVTEEPDDAR